MMIVVMSGGTLSESVNSGSVAAGNEETGQAGHSVMDVVLIPAFKGIVAIISLVQNYSPIDALSTGRSIPWSELGVGVRANRTADRRHLRPCRHRFFQPSRTGDRAGNPMSPRVKKILLLLLTAILVATSSQIQKSLNQDRDRLGLTHTATLDNAPPVLAFTTIALGGFRGLISNFLWIRANDLQQDDKFFEAAQLANWITDLEPHFTQVWLFQAWNMAYNISVKFKENAPGDYSDRWRWVENGVVLLRDQGLKYNPDNALIYRELAWFYQHKMGANLDDANMYYKAQWAKEMMPFFGPNGTNYDNLISPQTALDHTTAFLLREKYKLDPEFIKTVDDKYGPFDWRLPEAHAIYWGAKGLDAAQKNPEKVKADDLITLRRIIYQSIYQSFKHGHILVNPFTGEYSLGPNLDLVGRVNDAYTEMAKEDEKPRQHRARPAERFLRDAVYLLYVADRMPEAPQWYNYLGEQIPNKSIIDARPDALPKNLTLDEYAVAVVQQDIKETSQERVTADVQGVCWPAPIWLW